LNFCNKTIKRYTRRSYTTLKDKEGGIYYTDCIVTYRQFLEL